MEIQKLYEVLESLKKTSSRIEKESILRSGKKDELLQNVLKFLYDDLITTGLSNKKIAKPVNPVEVDNPNLQVLMDYLKKNNSGKDRDIALVRGYIQAFKNEYGENIANLVKNIVIKDYPAGVSKITLNKVFGKNFIFKFDVRKGSKFEGELKANAIYSQSVKIDGHRCVALVDKDGVKLFARSGKEYKGLITFEKALEAFYEEHRQPMMFDGELLAFNDNDLSSDKLFKVTSSRLRKDGVKSDIQYIMFDCMPLEEFKDGKSKLKFTKRREQLAEYTEILNTYTDGNKQGRKYFTNVKSLYQGNDLAEIQRVQKKMEELGYEGTMLDDINAYYTTKRTKTLLKFKTFYSADLRVLQLVEHTRGGKLGSIVVEYKGNELQVGSGFTEKQRMKYWQEPELIINKIVEVGYFEESSDKDGNLSLRFPTFKQIREDKTVYDVSYH